MNNENSPDSTPVDIAQEYNEFAYIVSHDLSTLLRHVKEMTRLLVDSTQTHLGEEEKLYVGFLELSLQKLDAMQEALLEFSRINTEGRAFEATSSQAVLEKILDTLPDSLAAFRHCVVFDTLPMVYADPRQCHQLFRYLVDNALKFHENEAQRKVSVSAWRRDDGILFVIEDNGIGMAAEFHEAVFRLFRKLNVEKRFPGTGAGLTLAGKIVNRHGGEIWIESAENAGARVFFTLPAQPPRPDNSD